MGLPFIGSVEGNGSPAHFPGPAHPFAYDERSLSEQLRTPTARHMGPAAACYRGVGGGGGGGGMGAADGF